ncbi:MAG: ABC transporter permease, partial [Clostridia bacterium]|nr:ABC transporter permease [Clostridia bacterium]
MRRKMLSKDTLREIRRSLGRYLSILAITAVGAAFFAGIRVTGPDMKLTADRYFDSSRLMDIHLLSTTGFTKSDVGTLRQQSGLLGAMPCYMLDALLPQGRESLVVKVMSLPSDQSGENDINRPLLLSGRLPQKSGECAIELNKFISSGVKIGSRITLSSGTDTPITDSLKTKSFVITGIVDSPYYISEQRGSSTIGNGTIRGFMVVCESDFKLPAYTDVFVTAKGALAKTAYTSGYDDLVSSVSKSLESFGKVRAAARTAQLKADATAQLDKGQSQYDSEASEANRALSTARSKLDVAKTQLAAGRSQLAAQQRQTAAQL